MARLRAKNERAVMLFLNVVLILAVIGLVSNFKPAITGYDVATSTSRVVIQSYVSISRSANLTDGINFGTLSSVPSYNRNATGNYNDSSNTLYHITVSQDSNSAVDFCFKAVTNLSTAGGTIIGIGNYTWSDDTANNGTLPAFPPEHALNFTYVAGSTNVPIGSTNYYRLWLNITAGQPPGTYNNSVIFQGVPNGDTCT